MGNDIPTVVVIDDSAEVRALVKTQIRLSGLLTVVGDGADGTEAINLAHQHRPDLVLLDMSMPTMDGLDAVHGIHAVSPDSKVVIYTGFDEQGLGARARELGAHGFIEKALPIDELAPRLVAVLRSEPPEAPPEPARRFAVVPDAPPGAAPLDEADAQSVLDEQVERFKEVFDEAAIGMATMTLTGGIVRANRALGRLVMRKHEDLVGLDYAVLTAGRADLLTSALHDVNERGHDLVQFEHDVGDAGEPRKVRATLAPVRDASGQALYIFLQVQDVTAQRAAEDELRQSEERFRLLVDVVEEYAIFMLSPEGIVVSWNAGAQRSKGYRAEEIIGRHFRTFYPPDKQAVRHPEYELERAMVDGHYAEEGWRVRKDGSQFWANVLITAVFDETGQHIGFAKVTRDVTAQRQFEEDLRQSEERFRLLVEAVGDYAIFMLDPEGRVASWNSGAQRNEGYSSREIIGQHFRIFYLPEDQERGHPEHELEIALRDGRYEEEGWRVRKDGSRFWSNVVITAVFNDVGDHIGFAKITRDTTERRMAEQEREQAAQSLAAANESLESLNLRLKQAANDQSQFLAVTAHELRTPASVLGGTAQTLARHWNELAEEERLGLLDGMTSSAERLRRLLSELLTASRLDAKALQIRPERTSLATLVGVAVATSRATRPDGEVTVQIETDADVIVDPDRMAQAVENLIDNAMTHGSPPVQIVVSTHASHAEIRVSDAGTGVNPEVAPRLFERFATGDSMGGTGLGLYIVRELARANGGDAAYEPADEGQPSGAFVLSLPLA